VLSPVSRSPNTADAPRENAALVRGGAWTGTGRNYLAGLVPLAAKGALMSDTLLGIGLAGRASALAFFFLLASLSPIVLNLCSKTKGGDMPSLSAMLRPFARLI